MQTLRRYSAEEIMRMQTALSILHGNVHNREEILRTYMFGGVEPDDLIAEINKVLEAMGISDRA